MVPIWMFPWLPALSFHPVHLVWVSQCSRHYCLIRHFVWWIWFTWPLYVTLMKSLVLRKAEDKTGMLNFKVEALLGMLPSTVSDTLTRVNELSLFSKVATRKWSARPGVTWAWFDWLCGDWSRSSLVDHGRFPKTWVRTKFIDVR